MSKRRIYGIIFIILNIILAMAPKTIAPTCHVGGEGKLMKCDWMGNAVIGISIALIVMAIIFVMVKDEKTAMGIVYANLVMGILTIMMPLKVIGTCMKPTMTCNTHTRPTILLFAGLYVLINLIYIIKNKKVA